MTQLARATAFHRSDRGACAPHALSGLARGLLVGTLLFGMAALDVRAQAPLGGLAPTNAPPIETGQGDLAPAKPLLFATASQRVAQWRSTFSVTLHLLTTASTPEEYAAWQTAFAELDPFEAPWELVRAAEVDARTTDLGGSEAVELKRTFTVRLTQTGPAVLGETTVTVGNRQATAAPIEVLAYTLDQSFYSARRQVLPLVASNTDAELQRIGSGFLIAPDALVTAYHVVVGTNRVRVALPNGKTLTTRRVWVLDPARDVAILHVDPERAQQAGVTPIPLSDELAPSTVTLTAGWPGGEQQDTEAARYADLHVGHRLLVTANSVGPGDSGGPLLDTRGEVLGVVVSGRNTRGEVDLLREDLCIAADLRPALSTLANREEPRPLRARMTMLEAAAPHAQLLRAVADLQSMRVRRVDAAPPRPHLANLMDAAARARRDPPLLFLLGTTLEKVGDRQAAANAYTQALEHAGGFFPAAYALGHHHLRRGEFAAAARLFEHTAEHPAYRHLAALGLARTHAERYAYRAAIDALRRALQADPGYAPALYLLAYSYLGLGDEATARMLHARLAHLDARWAERISLHLRARPLRPIALTDVSEVQ
ncbi:MAG: tetratricopeptide repeat-containing serine protease family protein [Bacteroidota bacterium]